MKKITSISRLFYAVLFTGLAAFSIAFVFDINPLPVAAVLVGGGLLVPNVSGSFSMALQKEMWIADIIGNLFKDNGFAVNAYNADQHVLDGKVVHMPQAGTPSTVKKNLTTFPQVAVNRTDSELTFSLDTMYSLPRYIPSIEKYELSYDKRQSVMGEDQANLIQAAMDSLLYRWSPASYAAGTVIETVGADSAADLIDATATGTRKLFTKDAFKTIAKKFATANVNGKLNALLTATHYHQFFESLSDAEKTDVGRVADLASGKVGRYMGFDIYMRSAVVRYRKVSTVWTLVDAQDDAFAAATGDSAASLFWENNSVTRALGDVDIFDDASNPLYYGDVFSMLMRLGGRQRRAAGVYAVVEAIGA